MKKLTCFIILYFSLSGVLLHAGAGYIYLFNKPLYEKAKYKALEQIVLVFPELRHDQSSPKQVYDLDKEIDINFGQWQPRPNYPVRASSQIFYSSDFSTLTAASKALKNGATLIIKEGIYQHPLIIEADDVTVIGKGHVVIERTNAERKGAIVIKGDYTKIANIECRHIEVADGNGACIRLEGKNLNVDQVYFHTSQQGLISAPKSGRVIISNSRFEKLGHRGYAHGMYIGGSELRIVNSVILASKDQAHEIKSRAKITTIDNSIISSLSSNDSRLIDISNGGHLKVTNSLLHQGPNSSNYDLIGHALEQPRFENGSITLIKNTIILEGVINNRLIHSGDSKTLTDIKNNLIIGSTQDSLSNQNIVFDSRRSAGIPDYPILLRN